ncbi:MAG: FxsA family protein [Oceanicoccus sp.]
MRFLVLLFIVVPIVEMWVLIEVGSAIGALSTIALVFLTAAVGLALLRQQGINTLLKVNARMERGELPAGEILEGVMLAVGGALLLTPGFITDVIGFCCLLPFTRKSLVAILLRQGVVMAGYGRTSHSSFQDSSTIGGHSEKDWKSPGSERQNNGGNNVIDGDFRREE